MNYLDLIQSYNLSWMQWSAIGLAAFLLGLSKAGIKGIGIIIVVILAFVFGEKTSTGILLPMLLCADVLAVIYYNRHAQWKYIFKLLPMMIVGVLVGVWLGNDISEIIFKKLMAIIIIGSVILMFLAENRKSTAVPKSKVFSWIMGFLAGFTTMIGNLAGPVANIYFLAIRFPKNEFIGTAAWLFFIINIFKLPFHIFVWKTVNVQTLTLNAALIPVVICGFFVGAALVKRISNLNYRRFILVVTAIGGVILLFR
ncbi:sulfite exporter TauE/SafE family protein [Gaetbulibacter aquiaggeris]|uniref:Probable membrane transporter protein n=1 Tax=Gaetbulibacter aquiaggeris TaxID=1735373 RepID=A0ABW7MNI0_9FLAO